MFANLDMHKSRFSHAQQQRAWNKLQATSTARVHESEITHQRSERHAKYMHIARVLPHAHNTYATTHHIHVLHRH